MRMDVAFQVEVLKYPATQLGHGLHSSLKLNPLHTLTCSKPESHGRQYVHSNFSLTLLLPVHELTLEAYLPSGHVSQRSQSIPLLLANPRPLQMLLVWYIPIPQLVQFAHVSVLYVVCPLHLPVMYCPAVHLGSHILH